MEYVIALLVLAGFGYFVYKKVTTKKETSGVGGGNVGKDRDDVNKV